MRKSEITPELIELSKQAKELGFPQDINEGDWHIQTRMKRGEIKEYIELWSPKVAMKLSPQNTLILSFSICLAWLIKKEIEVLELYRHEEDNGEFSFMMNWNEAGKGKTYHEAIAKAVVKVLEGE